MSSFDGAMRRQTAQSQAANAAQKAQLNARQAAAEAAVPRIQGLLRDCAQRLAASGVQVSTADYGRKVWRKTGWKRTQTPGLESVSPPGYLLGQMHFQDDSRTVIVLTQAGELFIGGTSRSGTVPITAQSILDGKVKFGGAGRTVCVSSDGVVGVDYGADNPKYWHSLEDTLAERAVELIAGRA